MEIEQEISYYPYNTYVNGKKYIGYKKYIKKGTGKGRKPDPKKEEKNLIRKAIAKLTSEEIEKLYQYMNINFDIQKNT